MPKQRGFLVSAGLEDCSFLESFVFEEEELAYLLVGFDDRAIEDFRTVRFEGEVGVPRDASSTRRSRSRVTAPIAQAQLVEAVLLNQVTLHTTLTSKAARYIIAAEGRALVDFAFRRAHGVEAARAARAGARSWGSRHVQRRGGAGAGTPGHGDDGAFVHHRVRRRTRGVPRVRRGPPAPHHVPRRHLRHDRGREERDRRDPRVASARRGGRASGLRRPGPPLARSATDPRSRRLEAARIFASGGLDEHEVAELVRAGAPVDAFGIGTQLGVSADAPYVDAVYKLVEFDGRPVLKLSPAKATAPGRKQVWRGPSEDVIGLRDEAAPGPNHEPLLEPVMRAGRRLAPAPTIEEMHARFARTSKALPVKAARLTHPEHVVAHRTEALAALTTETAEAARRRSVRATDSGGRQPGRAAASNAAISSA